MFVRRVSIAFDVLHSLNENDLIHSVICVHTNIIFNIVECIQFTPYYAKTCDTLHNTMQCSVFRWKSGWAMKREKLHTVASILWFIADKKKEWKKDERNYTRSKSGKSHRKCKRIYYALLLIILSLENRVIHYNLLNYHDGYGSMSWRMLKWDENEYVLQPWITTISRNQPNENEKENELKSRAHLTLQTIFSFAA